MHDWLVGCDGGSVSPSVRSAGFCAGAGFQSADGRGGGWRGYGWGGAVHQVVFNLQIKTWVRIYRVADADNAAGHLLLLLGSCPLSLLLLLLLLQLSPGWRCLELLLECLLLL